MKRHIMMSLVVITLMVLSVTTIYAAAFTSGELLFAHDNWDYTPSAMVDLDSKTKVWWCGEQAGRDVIKYREKSPGGNWSNTSVVLQSNRYIPGAPILEWEGVFTCDPTVTRGSWTYLGNNYSYIMYYTTEKYNPVAPSGSNRIGMALSTNGIDWVKYTPGPVINDGDTGSAYGTGQSVAWSASAGSGVRTIYTFVDTNGDIKYYYRESADGISFGPRTEITQAGLTVNGVAAISHGSPALAFAPASYGGRYYYYIASVCESHNNDVFWGKAKGVCVYRIEGNKLFTGTWERILDSGHIKPVEVEPGFLSNHYGYIDSFFPSITMYFGCSGSGDPTTWELCWATGNQP